MSNIQTRWVPDAWPSKLTTGFITYSPSTTFPNDSGFVLYDANHGIPVFGSVRTQVFNYPGQTEDIARRLVLCWNAMVGRSIEEIELLATENAVYQERK